MPLLSTVVTVDVLELSDLTASIGTAIGAETYVVVKCTRQYIPGRSSPDEFCRTERIMN
jgi:hypothetical protein